MKEPGSFRAITDAKNLKGGAQMLLDSRLGEEEALGYLMIS